MKRIGIYAVVGSLAILGATGCSSNKAEESEPVEEVVVEEVQSLDDTENTEPVDFVIDNDMVGEYTLTGYNIEGVETDVEELNFDEPVVLTIDEFGNVNTNVCNFISSSINDEGETTPGMSTMMYCETPEGIMEAETGVTSSMGGIVATDVDNNGVVFIGIDGTQSFWTLATE